MNLKFKIGDLFIAFLIITVAVPLQIISLSALATDGEQFVVLMDGVQIASHSLKEDNTYTIEGDYTNVIAVKDGAVFIEHSNCPGGDCLLSGSIHTAGKSIICLPNRVEIKVVGESNVDGVVG